MFYKNQTAVLRNTRQIVTWKYEMKFVFYFRKSTLISSILYYWRKTLYSCCVHYKWNFEYYGRLNLRSVQRACCLHNKIICVQALKASNNFLIREKLYYEHICWGGQKGPLPYLVLFVKQQTSWSASHLMLGLTAPKSYIYVKYCV